MPEALLTGWDLGGAHLKAAQVTADGRVRAALQLPCPLWQGIDRLEQALDAAAALLAPVSSSTLTMTGELADLFADRREGVRRLLEVFAARLPGGLRLYAGPEGFVAPDEAVRRPQAVASANWHASAALAAGRVGDGLFIDVGSTTTDIVPLAKGKVAALGITDLERLAAAELVYTGVTRTPVMALAEAVPFGGRRVGLMAELFATAADVHRLLGVLPDDADQLPAADGGAKTVGASARRLARMVGSDADEAPAPAWRRLAGVLAEAQLRRLHDACLLVLSRGLFGDGAPVIGAGAGRFVARRLAARLERPYRDAASLILAAPEAAEWAARCLPAVAVALLARDA